MAKIKLPGKIGKKTGRKTGKKTGRKTGRKIVVDAKSSLTTYGGRKMSTKSQTIRNVLQCKSNTLKRERCRKRTAHTRKCWIHLAKENNLRIKPSNIPNAGKGLFSWKKPFNRNKNIAVYTGRKTNQLRIDRRYGPTTIAQYSLCDGPWHCVDANISTHGPARFANDARGSRLRNNSCFRGTTKNNRNFKLQATKRIKPNEEILADYGPNYWPRGYFKRVKRAS